MAKLYSECTVHVHCAKNASIYTMNYFGDLETSLVSKYTPLFFLFAEIHFSACFLHVHVFCMFCMFCMFSACFLHVFASTSKGGNWLPGKPKVSLLFLACDDHHKRGQYGNWATPSPRGWKCTRLRNLSCAVHHTWKCVHACRHWFLFVPRSFCFRHRACSSRLC